jgi:ribosomal protein S18 acetylase RimI-like enzyme
MACDNRAVVTSLKVDRDLLRTLVVHEARLQTIGGRELRDLGDGVLLVDRVDPEPYWNRLVVPDWPADHAQFDRRTDTTIMLFATLGRLPHIWPLPTANHPPDIARRLRDSGFEVMGSDRMLILADPRPATRRLAEPLAPDLTIERLHGLGRASMASLPDAAAVLADAFAVGPDRRHGIELETIGAMESPSLHVVLIRVSGRAAAVAKRATRDGITYLSSIGTVPHHRNRGLGGLVTALAVADAVAAGSRWIYLKVDVHNVETQALYERLGFVAVPGQIDDLLLRR